VPVVLVYDVAEADVPDGGAEEPALPLVLAERGAGDGRDVALIDCALGDEADDLCRPIARYDITGMDAVKRAALSRNRLY